jgi:Fic family protein
MFAAGPTGFEGGMTAGKYIALTRCAKATATRDLSALLKIGALTNLPGGGRSTRYALSHMEPAAPGVEPDEPVGD